MPKHDQDMLSCRDIASEMSAMLDESPLLAFDFLPGYMGATPAEVLGALAELLELQVAAVWVDPNESGVPPMICGDDGLPLEQFASPADGLAAVAEALGVESAGGQA